MNITDESVEGITEGLRDRKNQRIADLEQKLNELRREYESLAVAHHYASQPANANEVLFEQCLLANCAHARVVIERSRQ